MTNLLLTKLARDRTVRISALGPLFSQYGPRAWLIRYIYVLLYIYFRQYLLRIIQVNFCN